MRCHARRRARSFDKMGGPSSLALPQEFPAHDRNALGLGRSGGTPAHPLALVRSPRARPRARRGRNRHASTEACCGLGLSGCGSTRSWLGIIGAWRPLPAPAASALHDLRSPLTPSASETSNTPFSLDPGSLANPLSSEIGGAKLCSIDELGALFLNLKWVAITVGFRLWKLHKSQQVSTDSRVETGIRKGTTRMREIPKSDVVDTELRVHDNSVTAVLLSYNCQNYIGEALASVLEQDYEGLRVFVSDDASNDNTFEIIKALVAQYQGKHDVFLNRQQSNSGSKTAHLNAILNRIDTEFIVSFDGDDISQPFRVSRIMEEFVKNPHNHAVYSGMTLIDREGRPLGTTVVPHPPEGENVRTWFARVDAYAAGATFAVRRSVLTKFGEMDPAVNEDVIIPFRASLLGDVTYIDEELVIFRRHPDSLTTQVDALDSVETYRRRLWSGIDMARASARLRLSDIDVAERVFGQDGDEMSCLRATVIRSLRYAELTGNLIEKRFVARFKALIKIIFAGAYSEERLEHFAMVFAPNLFVRVRRWRMSRKLT